MPRDGSGNYSRTNGNFTGPDTWKDQAASDPVIRSPQHDTHDQDIADALTASVARDGQSPMTGDLNMSGNRVTNVGAPLVDTDAIRRGDSFEVRATELIAGRSTIPFSSLPDWAVELTMPFTSIQTTGALNVPEVQLGTSGGFVQTGYLGSVGRLTTSTAINLSTGFSLAEVPSSASILHGHMTLAFAGNNVWTASCNVGNSASGQVNLMSGAIALGAQLTQIRLAVTNTTFTGPGGVNLIIKG